MYTCTCIFLNKDWIILYILFNNALFKMCIYIVEYVMHTQVQNSRITKRSGVRSNSLSCPVCQRLVSLQLLVYPFRDSYTFSNVCIYFVTNGSTWDTLSAPCATSPTITRTYHFLLVLQTVSTASSLCGWTLIW